MMPMSQAAMGKFGMGAIGLQRERSFERVYLCTARLSSGVTTNKQQTNKNKQINCTY